MNTPSPFQQRLPLSPRKFWKKMISKSVGIFVAALILGGVIGPLITVLLLVDNPQMNVRAFFWTSLLAFFVVLVAISAIYSIYVRVYIRRYYYDAAAQYLTIQKGVFAPTEIHVPYGKIQDVYVDQDVLDRIMGLYDVHIASAPVTSGIEAHIDGVETAVAEELKNFLLNKIQYGNGQPTQNLTPTQSQPTAIPAPQGPQAGTFSAKSYPISSAWIVKQIFTCIGRALFWTFMIFYIFTGKFAIYFGILPPLLVFLILYLVTVVWQVLWRATYFFEFLPQFILLKDGIIQREEKHVPYRSLQNVLLKQSILDRILGLSTVVIENAAMGSTKTGRASTIIIPGQPLTKGNEIVVELNRILGTASVNQAPGL